MKLVGFINMRFLHGASTVQCRVMPGKTMALTPGTGRRLTASPALPIVLAFCLAAGSCVKGDPGNNADLVDMLVLAAIGGSSSDLAAELDALNLDKYLDDVPYASHAPYASDPTWDIYTYDLSVCKCVGGAPFLIGVKNKGRTNNVVFTMAGGGACWPGKESCETDAVYPSGWGDSAGNPLTDWNVVHVPYCDGSVHMGDNDADYDGDGSAEHFHRGLRLTTAAIAVMRELYPSPDRIFITGCSAGGYGTFMAYLLNRRFFPNAAIYVLNDSGPGLWNPDNGMKDLIVNAWNYTPFFPESCTRCNEQILYLYDWILRRDTRVRIGLFSSYYDHVIGTSFLDMEPEAFKSLLVSASGTIHAAHRKRFNRFLIEGDTHCIGEVASQYSYTVKSVTLLQWITRLVTDDPAWSDLLE
jgi:hypothetical protein